MFDEGVPGGGHGGHGGRKRSWEGGAHAAGSEQRGPRRSRWEGGGEPGAEERGPRGGGRGGRGGRGGGRGRARRGDARAIILDALRDGPKHGYEIIKTLEERSAGQYAPSPGTVYPTLQYLEDQGFVRASEEAGRRVYQLTEAGEAELDALAGQVTAFWQRFGGQEAPSATQHEMRFLREELEQLNHIVWDGLRPAIAAGQDDALRSVRSAIEACKNKVREIIAASGHQPR